MLSNKILSSEFWVLRSAKNTTHLNKVTHDYLAQRQLSLTIHVNSKKTLIDLIAFDTNHNEVFVTASFMQMSIWGGF